MRAGAGAPPRAACMAKKSSSSSSSMVVWRGAGSAEMKVDIALIGGGDFDSLRDACCRCSALDVCVLLLPLLPPPLLPPPLLLLLLLPPPLLLLPAAGDAAACCHAQLVEPEDNTATNRTEPA